MEIWTQNFWQFFFIFMFKFPIFQIFRGKFRQGGQVVANETSKIIIYAKFGYISCMTLFVPICSCTTLKHARIYLWNQVTRVQTLPFFIASPYLRTFLGAFLDPQRSGLSEIYPKIWRFWHWKNLKNVRFWTKKTHCALLKHSIKWWKEQNGSQMILILWTIPNKNV